MATWMTHLRIADQFIQNNPHLNQDAFLIGNIAPDCGVPTHNNKEFNPPKEITHFKDQSVSYEEYDNIHLERFFNDYVLPNKHHKDYLFFVGYYLHLLVDVLWHQYQMEKRKDSNYLTKFMANQKIYRDELLQIDLQYLDEVKDNIYLNHFIHFKDVNDYFTILPSGMINRHVKHILAFYQQDYHKVIHPVFTSYDELNTFINHSTELIIQHMKTKSV